MIQRNSHDRAERKSVPTSPGRTDRSGGFWRLTRRGLFPATPMMAGPDYGPVGAFVGRYIRLVGRDANSFEIVQANDKDGAAFRTAAG